MWLRVVPLVYFVGVVVVVIVGVGVVVEQLRHGNKRGRVGVVKLER